MPVPAARPVPSLSLTYYTRLYQAFVKHELHERKRPQGEVTLTLAEVGALICDVFRCRCALTGTKLHDPARRRWCPWPVASPPRARATP